MLGGFLEFFMKPDLAETYQKLRVELEELIRIKVSENHILCIDRICCFCFL